MQAPSVLTVRNIPRDVALAIARRAAQTGTSLNRAAIELLREAIAPPAHRPARTRPVRHDDLDEVIGSATSADADTLDEALRDLRRVDPRDWR